MYKNTINANNNNESGDNRGGSQRQGQGQGNQGNQGGNSNDRGFSNYARTGGNDMGANSDRGRDMEDDSLTDE